MLPRIIPALFCLASVSVSAANLSEIYELAVENDAEIKADEARYMSVKQGVPIARSALLPSLSVSGSKTENTQTVPTDFESESTSWSASLRQPVFNIASWFSLKQAKNRSQQALAEFTDNQQKLIVRVAEGYFGILEAHDRLTAAQAEKEAVQRQLEQVQQRFDVGLVAITDLLESTAAYDNALVGVIEAEGRQMTSFETLLRLTNQSLYTISSLKMDFPVEHPEPRDEEAWVRAALEGNYSLAAARESVNVARRGLTIVRSGHYPTVNASANFNKSTSSDDLNPIDFDTEGRSISISVNVPVFSSGSVYYASKQAAYSLESSQNLFDLKQRTVVEGARNFYKAISTDVARVRATMRGIESSRSALEATETGYEVGTRNIVDVLLAQQRLYKAQFNYASARYQYIKDVLGLKHVAGALSPDDIHELNNYMDQNRPVSRFNSTSR